MKTYHTYIIANKSRTVLYCGMTNNLQRRIAEHQSGKSNFTSRYNVHHLVWCESFQSPMEAIAAEKRIKRMTRLEKIKLIENLNPNWEFLERDQYCLPRGHSRD